MSRSLVQSIRQFGPITETEDKEWIIDLNDKENNTDEEMNGLVNSARINTENWVCIVEPCDCEIGNRYRQPGSLRTNKNIIGLM